MKWRLQSCCSAGLPEWDAAGPHFIDVVKRASSGRIEITQYAPGTLVPSFEIFTSVGEGVVEMGWSCAIYEQGIAPIGEFWFAWPFLFDGKRDLACFEAKLGGLDVLRRGYGEHNVYPLVYSIGGGYDGMMANKPLSGLDDMKGLKVRAGGVYAEIVERLGGGVTMVPMEELYTAHATGLIDASFIGVVNTYYALGVHEAVKYYVGPAWSPQLGCGLMINLDLWNSLDDDLKAILQAAGHEADYIYDSEIYYANAQARKSMIEDYGVTFMDWDDEAIAEFKRLSAEILEEKATTDEYWAEMATVVKEFLALKGR